MRLLWIAASDELNRAEDTLRLRAVDGLTFQVCGDPAGALEELRQSGYDAVLADVPPEGWLPEDWVEQFQRADPLAPVIVRADRMSSSRAASLAKLGAFDVVDRNSGWEQLIHALEKACEYRNAVAPERDGGGDEPWTKFLIGTSRAMRNIASLVRLVGDRRCTVLITGETGTGKEVIARAIHLAGNRAHLPIVAVNCSALPENLLEAELFGHVKGAFTGAVNSRIGRFEQAQRSTLFLDEIGDLPLELQTKLLRVLQERELQRLGSSESVRLDVRVIAATNADLTEMIQEGSFREDLFYRLNVVPVRVPSLRERLSDIPLLVQHFLEKICRAEDVPLKHVSQETLDRLKSYHWPGNVRQLENAIEMAVALSGDREWLYPGDFPLPAPARPKSAGLSLVRVPDEGLNFERAVSRFEWSLLDQALQRTRGNKKRAADILGLKRTTLTAKLKSLEAVAAGY